MRPPPGSRPRRWPPKPPPRPRRPGRRRPDGGALTGGPSGGDRDDRRARGLPMNDVADRRAGTPSLHPSPAAQSRADPPADPFDAVLAEYLEAAQAGATPDPAAFIVQHPQFAAELADFFADQAGFARLAAPFRPPAGVAGGPASFGPGL